jgi:hypothetical protein
MIKSEVTVSYDGSAVAYITVTVECDEPSLRPEDLTAFGSFMLDRLTVAGPALAKQPDPVPTWNVDAPASTEDMAEACRRASCGHQRKDHGMSPGTQHLGACTICLIAGQCPSFSGRS